MRHAQTLNEAQFRKVLHYCRTRRHANRDTAIFMVSFFAGLRAKEIAALKLGDVFDADGRVREQFTLESDQTKGGQRRSIRSTNVRQLWAVRVGQRRCWISVLEDCTKFVCSKSKFFYCVEVTMGQTLCCIYCVNTANPNTVFNTVNHPTHPRTNT